MKTEITKEEAAMLELAKTRGLLGKALIYSKLSGPGWLQGAITLGGGSLTGALYLGVLFGPHMLWLQPVAMICGVIMLSAITYVTLSTSERPFGLVMRRISPVLAWAWLIAAAVANMVWCLPQFALAVAAIQQNLLPEGMMVGTYPIALAVLVTCIAIVSCYNRSGGGVLWFERILKAMVALIVIAFVGVTAVLVFNGGVDIRATLWGHIPSLEYLTKPTPAFQEAIARTGENAPLWTQIVVADHSGKMITAFGTAVGINMTFLLPYSILKRNWGRRHRGLAIFDLSVGLIIPFVIATGCLVIASASQFHGKFADVLTPTGEVRPGMQTQFDKALEPLLGAITATGRTANPSEAGETITAADREVAAMLSNRDVGQLATSLEPFTGRFLAQKIFGLGVLGMAVSTIIMLMVINGFTTTEAFGRPDDQRLHMAGALIPGIIGFWAPVLWTGDAKAALTVPASVIGGSLIPIAYLAFFLLMNSRSTLGDEMPRGAARIRWNILMLFSLGVASFGSVWVIFDRVGKPGFEGMMALAGLILLGLLFCIAIFGYLRNNRGEPSAG